MMLTSRASTITPTQDLFFATGNLKNLILASSDDEECVTELRLVKKDLKLLMHYLEIPEKIICSQGAVCSGIEGLCILLKRLAYP